jgi:hypothetical protein
LTWEEFANKAYGYSQEDTVEYLRETLELTKSQAKKYLNFSADDADVLSWWLRDQSPNALAYRYLEGIDLGPAFGGKGKTAGDIYFTDGFHPGNETLWVEVPDLLSISLLQGRLNELDTGIKLELLDGDDGLA